jgi:beta-glucanase (GH16 family)
MLNASFSISPRTRSLRDALVSGLLTACSARSEMPDPCGLVPVFLEDFDSLSVAANTIGPARWTAHTPWSGDFGDAAFIDPGPDGPFRIEDGILSITAKKDEDGRWTSGLLAAADASGRGFGTRYGYFEARMKLPPGKGTWPAFWLAALMPVGEGDGKLEVDVMEYYGQFPSAFRSSLHVWFSDPNKKREWGSKTDVAEGSLVNGFNTYGVDVSPEWIVYYLNGQEHWREATPPELTYPLYPIVNLALGSGWPIDETPSPSVLLVDYVHVWGRADPLPADCAASRSD